ncbi:MAG: adenosylcobinamide-GDP ribazoletransferase [Snowella sp.]|nr:adenosylcobinamide-GDP ribazoletransferase [Snowella sp.]
MSPDWTAKWRGFVGSLGGAMIFYTCMPLPTAWPIQFDRIARWCPLIGLILGASLGLLDGALGWLGFPNLVRSIFIVAIAVGLTGGLHLDGVSDTADGLAVTDPERRLVVMKDSLTGAFGVMAIALVLLLKFAALSELGSERWFCLMVAMGWGRWGQVAAIAFYPYLRAEGKGGFHTETFKFPQDLLLGLFFLILFSLAVTFWQPQFWLLILQSTLLGFAIALLTGWWFAKRLGGHTGDSYGAIVEWTEALILCGLTIWFN